MFGMSLGNLFVRIGADTTGLKQGEAEAAARSQNIGRSLASIGKVAAVAAAAVVAAASAITVAMVKSSMSTIDAQSKLAGRVGASVIAIQTLEHAANLAGVSSEGLSKSLGTLNARLGEAAREGIGPAAEALERLGFRAHELSAMDADERIAALGDRMQELGYTTQQQADVLRDFGIRNQEMINLMQGGGEAIRDARQDIEDFGLAVSDVAAVQVEQANDAMTRMFDAMGAVGNQIATRLAPIIQGVADYITNSTKEAGGFGDAIDTAISLAIRLVGALMDEWRNTQETIIRLKMIWQQAMAAMNAAWAGLVNKVMEGVAAIREAWNSIATTFGADPIPAYSPNMQKFVADTKAAAADSAAAVAATKADLDNLLSQPLPSEGLDAWLADIQEKSLAAAQATIDARKAMTEGGEDTDAPFGGTGAAEKLAEQMETRLATLREALLTEEEAERNSYAQRMLDLQEFLEAGMITRQEYDDLSERAQQEHHDRMVEIARRAAEEEIRMRNQVLISVGQIFGSIGQIIGSFGEKNLAASKAFATAQALINTYVAVTEALRSPAGFPVNFALAAAAAAQGFAQVAAINSTNKGSKSPITAGGAGASGAAGSAAAGSTKAVTINLSGDTFGKAQVKSLVEQINQEISDGATLLSFS